jgi:signal peptidase I
MTSELEEQKKQQKQSEQSENFIIETIKVLGTALILAVGIRTFVAEARYIPSSSMEKTLLINDRLIIEKIAYHFKQPQRGDVIVFSTDDISKLQEENFKNEAFIKRVIGLPGDTVSVSDGIVYVNQKPLQEKYIAEKPNQDFGPVTVPPNHYFVMGDNRNNSYDSRFWGFVPKRDIIGRAIFRFWPLDRLGTIDTTPLYPKN